MIQHPLLASMPLKRERTARGARAPRASSSVDGFCQQPSPEFAADSVVPPICHLARAAAQTLLAVIGEAAQNDTTLATTPGGPAAVEPVERWPRCDEPARLPHDGRSDSPVQ